MSLSRKITIILFIAVILVMTGFYRDFIFKNINSLLQAMDAGISYTLPNSLSFLENCNSYTLIKTKWLLTFFFSLSYFLITLITIQLFFKNKNYSRISVVSYAAISAISGLLMLAGYIIPSLSERMYEFARYLMGMLQSPVILMILFAAFKFYDKDSIRPTSELKK